MSLRSILTFSALILVLTGAMAQGGSKIIKGKVYDSESNSALAFVTVVANSSQSGTYTDIDGKFTLISDVIISSIKLTYVGYESKTIEIDGSADLEIHLVPSTYQLIEAVITGGENPAHRIIRRTIASKKENNPEKGKGFSYESYNKLIFTGDQDSTNTGTPVTVAAQDSSQEKVDDFFEDQHLFLMESVSERKFMPPDNNSEVIKATRVSGLKTPDFALLATQLQSFSFYREEIRVLEYSYLSPIAKGAISKYVYTLEDTTYAEQDTVFVISYQPRTGKNFSGLKGLLYINTSGYAIQNVIAQPFEKTEFFDIKIQQQYEKVGGIRWFPVQLNTFIYLSFANVNGMGLLGIGRSYLQNIQVEQEFRKREFNHVAIKMDTKSAKQPESFWNKYRPDSLDAKELKTYHVMDSIGKAENIDLKLKTAQSLISGRIPIGIIDLELAKLMDYNGYEGLRLGLGGYTNHNFSERLILGGYGAYGFRDKEAKFGGAAQVNIDRKRDVFFKASYSFDVDETGNLGFNERRSAFDQSSYYRFYMNRMDQIERYQADFGFRALRHFAWKLSAGVEDRIAFEGYDHKVEASENVALLKNEFRQTFLGAEVRFAFKEKFVETLNRRISIGTRFPVLRLSLRKALPDVLDADQDFLRVDASIEKTFRLKNIGRLSLLVRGGYVDNDIPMSYGYNFRGTFGSFGLQAPYSFETMRVNEFFGTRYTSFHLRHSFENLLIRTEKFSPEFVLVYNALIAEMPFSESHSGVEYDIPTEPYLEGGLMINNLYSLGFTSFGIGAFYRHGQYEKEDFSDNLAVKMSLGFAF